MARPNCGQCCNDSVETLTRSQMPQVQDAGFLAAGSRYLCQLRTGHFEHLEIDPNTDHGDPVTWHAQALDVSGFIGGVGSVARRSCARSLDARTIKRPPVLGMNGTVQHDGHAVTVTPRHE